MSWICPKCERELKHRNAWHSCAKVELDSLFENKAPELPYVFDKLLAEVMNWKDVMVSTTQNCIVFVHNKTFLIIRPMKKELDLKFYLKEETESALIVKSTFHAGKFECHIRVSVLDDISAPLITFIRRSYEIL